MSGRTKNTLILGAGLLALGVLWGVSTIHIDTPLCPFKALTGLPCPGCGGTRVFRLLCEARVGEALMLNPLSVLLIVFLAVSAAWLTVDIIRDRQSYISFMTRRWPRLVVAAVIAALLLNWLWNICKGL